MNSHGYELELRLNKVFNNGMRVWLNTNMTHAINDVKFKDAPALLPDYQKAAGHAIDQTYSYIDRGNLATWDDVIGSTGWNTLNENKLPGDYNIVDFNGDGTITEDDKAPYQYSSTPQNTYSASVGWEWKGFSVFAQFYGVKNVSREVQLISLNNTVQAAFDTGAYWTPDGTGTLPMPRWGAQANEAANGTRYWYDGSYIRLSYVTVGYDLSRLLSKKCPIKGLKVSATGRNLFLLTKYTGSDPQILAGTGGGTGSAGIDNYSVPTTRSFNFSLSATF